MLDEVFEVPTYGYSFYFKIKRNIQNNIDSFKNIGK